MNKRVSRILSLAIALLICVAMAAPAMAIGVSDGGSASVEFDKNLFLPSAATSVPEKTFTFTLEPSDNTNGSTNISGYAGIVSGVKVNDTGVTMSETKGTFTVTFDDESTLSTGTNAKYATESFTIDFSGVTFPADQPGVYRYKLTENNNTSDPSIVYSTTVYYIDVYVEYEKDASTGEWSNTLTIGSIVVTETTPNTVTNDQTQVSGKIDDGHYDNTLNDYNVTLEKNVTGNQGERNKDFEFTVALEDVDPDGEYTISGDVSATISVANGSGSATINLQDGQTVTINDLPYGAKWTITEKDYTGSNGGYTTTYVVDAEDSKTGRVASDDNGITANATVVFTNHREGVIPTGVLLTIAPFAALLVVGLAGVIFILRKKKD